MTASEHRARARAALKGNWPWAVLTSFVAVLVGAISSSGGNFEINISQSETISLNSLPQAVQTVLTTVLGVTAVLAVIVAIVVAVVQLIVGGVAGIGYRQYLLNLIDGQEAEFSQLFSQFYRLGQAVLVRLLRGLIGWVSGAGLVALVAALVPALDGAWLLAFGAFLLMMALIGVGIYVDYGFEMCEFIMAEDESCGAVDALKRSWRMMSGNRWRLFCMEMSFIGWSILAAFTLGIGGLFLTPYVQTATASFYRELRPRAVPDFAVNDGYTDNGQLPGGHPGIEE